MFSKKKNIVILAAGKSTRMRSKIPKIFHNIGGKLILQHVVDTVLSLKRISSIYLVCNDQKEVLKKISFQNKIKIILQKYQLGTGYALRKVINRFDDESDVIVLYGDVPLISSETIEKLILSRSDNAISLLTANLKDPIGYGRIIRKNKEVIKIVEESEILFDEKDIKEVYSGMFVSNAFCLKKWLHAIHNQNSKKEYYLTDIVSLARKEGYKINTIHPKNSFEIQGINDPFQLMKVERFYQKYQAKKLLLSGLMISNISRFDLRGKIKYGKDVYIDNDVSIIGKVILGNDVRVGIGCILKNCKILDNSSVLPYSIIESSVISKNCVIGPFAHLRDGVILKERSKIGNFVEIKNTVFGSNSKARHLSYLGDSEIGSQVNIGAGVITCNYDGKKKFQTRIEDNVFVGSDCQLIAPITIQKNSTIGAGTTLTDDVKENELVTSRIQQKHIKNWRKSLNKR
ncbi:bifunctional UDP-N-acetylglucosamine diphosphorylase/glucosamine-1-phosphate N-acetyltransferase GlmU [Candidatus Riesia pediculicola]|uniref:bifunctional UDP-N-acetylglucosamine diphosphorylase/glucosamine-1-phosphate N-acetyltransferase GlmU n=1 Tax=Candidatus Riesia pediculicola TaxID=401619 RepID=UPI0009C24407|nr:bifunctional UDP-N-acetylglucosamine diphosphorylase/glucosamine-1-phosphate N-acetyltransferase GlmU [Candidatus Riesia pediculicola]ARC54105.1 bifunctional N-acetylglucosamine-1-phosphate uridyltransferase/glucosamine-1-phosphate acetyltransferase [Candidatus Riesia pediculicola]